MKAKIFDQPYNWFWYSIPLMLIIGRIKINSAFDLQFHDTYIVISYFHIACILAIYFSIVGYIYWLFKKKKMVKWMTYFHSAASIILIFTLLLTDIYPHLKENSDIPFDYEYIEKVKVVVSYLFVVWLFSQFIFILNLVVSIFR